MHRWAGKLVPGGSAAPQKRPCFLSPLAPLSLSLSLSSDLSPLSPASFLTSPLSLADCPFLYSPLSLLLSEVFNPASCDLAPVRISATLNQPQTSFLALLPRCAIRSSSIYSSQRRLSVIRMDCSLSTWPSITQLDDITWMGLADIDPLESFGRNLVNVPQFMENSFTNPEETNLASPATKVAFNDMSVEIPHAKSDDFYGLTSSDSLAVARWESINAMDLSSVLDNFPSSNETSSPGEEDVYDLYSESIIMQAEPQIAGDADVFMTDSMSELPEAKNVTLLSEVRSPRNDASLMSSDHTSVSCTQEDVRCEVSAIDDRSPPSVNISGSMCGSVPQISRENPLLRRVDCSAHHVVNVDNGVGGSRVKVVQPAGCFAFCPMKLPDCVDPSLSSQGALNLRQSIAMPQHDSIQPSMMIHWPKPHSPLASSQLFNREQVVQQSPIRSYPAIIDQQLRMADAARITSELKRNRAQASRARRLAASQRRAKKYPLQKLIRMSSSAASTRDKVDQNVSTEAAMPHQALQQAYQTQQPTTTPKAHLPTLLPVPQGTQLVSSHELLTHANVMPGAPYYHHQSVSSASPQDNLVSPSGSSTLPATHGDQNVHSLSTLPSLAISHMLNPVESLDAIVLNQLQGIISKMNVGTRICIRDALCRLARSVKIRHSRCENVPGLGLNSSHSEVMETNTNSTDRWIVNMLFCKQSTLFDRNSQPYVPQTITHTTENNNTNTIMQQWNSCGSFLNMQDQPLHVVTGL